MATLKTNADIMEANWKERMGAYTDRTLKDVMENVWEKYLDKKTRGKTLTLNERYIIWKVKSLCWEKSKEYYPTIQFAFGWKVSGNPNMIAWKATTTEMEIENPITEEKSIVYADCGMTFDDWVKYRKDNKVRTFI
jgi:hypothetical protein